MAKHTLKILQCWHRTIFKVCLAIFQHYAWKGQIFKDNYENNTNSKDEYVKITIKRH